MQELDVTAQLWGVTYYQIWAKEKGYAEFEKFSYTYCAHYESASESDQPRSFLARLPL